MSNKKRGLGKGLGALFDDNTTDVSGDGIIKLKITDIEPNRDQPRQSFNDESLLELANSISTHGVLSPLIVRPIPTGGYELVAGERRWRASRLAGIKEIPAIIKNLSNSESAEITLIENVQREDLNPIEEAFGYKSLMEEFSLTQEEVAKRVSKSRPAIANAVRLLNLPENVLEHIRTGEISSGHGKVLLGLEGDELSELLTKILIHKLSVRETEDAVKQLKKPATKGKNKKSRGLFPSDSYFNEVEIAMNEELGHKVIVKEKKGKGILEIHFSDKEELSNIIAKIIKE